MLEITNQDEYETFAYNLDSVVGEEDKSPDNKILTFEYINLE